jgi:hypothetical protein
MQRRNFLAAISVVVFAPFIKIERERITLVECCKTCNDKVIKEVIEQFNQRNPLYECMVFMEDDEDEYS